MGKKKGKKERVKKEKKEKKKVKTKKHSHYKIEGDALKRDGKFCPKCGAGVIMAKHKDRDSCGTCGFTEHKVKKE